MYFSPTISAILFTITLTLSLTITKAEILETSEEERIVQGDSGSIYCLSDAPFDSCTWKNEAGDKCTIASHSENVECSNGIWNILNEGEKCSLELSQGATRADVGTYTCHMITDDNVSTGEASIDVLVEATLEFGGDFSEPGEVNVPLGSTSMLECNANAGYPEPDITASIVDENGDIVRELEEVPDLATSETDGDSLTTLGKQFILMPSIEEDEFFVKCEVTQGDDFALDDTRQVGIVFQPQPAENAQTVFHYQNGFETMVGIRFNAHPPPEPNEAIWHHIPSHEEEYNEYGEYEGSGSFEVDYPKPPPYGEFVLEPGQSTEDGRFQALELNITGHEIYAVLLVRNSEEDLKDLTDGEYYLEASNAYGSQNYVFSFEAHIDDTENFDEMEDMESEEEASSMGSGGIAAIIIVILGIILGISLTIYAKNSNIWCFANSSGKPDYNQAPTVDPEAGKAQEVRKEPPLEETKVDQKN